MITLCETPHPDLLFRPLSQAIAFSIPVLASVLAFVTYALSGHSLDPAIIFTSLSLFTLLRQPLMFLPRALSAITDAQNALSRLSRVFNADTLEEDTPIQKDLPFAIVVDNAEFRWESPPPIEAPSGKKSPRGLRDVPPPLPISSAAEPFSLQNINIKVPRGQLCAIVGSVGSGKSSLLQGKFLGIRPALSNLIVTAGLIGEMRRIRGSVSRGGSLAYCAQTPWIQNATLVCET